MEVTSESLEGDRAVLIRRTSGGSSGQFSYLYRNLVPQEDEVFVEFLFNHSVGNGRARFEIHGGSSYSNYITVKMYNGQIRNGDTAVTPYNLGQIYKIKVDVVPNSATYDLYVDDVLVGDNLAVSSTRSTVSRIYFRPESTSSIDFIIDDTKVNLTNNLCSDISLAEKFNSMIVMSDGQANIGCAMDPVPDRDTDGDITNDPDDHAIEAACRAHEDYNITVYAIGFGGGADQFTLQQIADCGGGDYYFS